MGIADPWHSGFASGGPGQSKGTKTGKKRKQVLCNQYSQCACARTKITGYHPIRYSPEDRALYKQYYERALKAFYDRNNLLPTEKADKMRNMWAFSAYMKLIWSSSTRLSKGHDDYYESLHTQGPTTEQSHSRTWNEMAQGGDWSFE